MSYRDEEHSVSNRSLLRKALETDMLTDEESQLLSEYHSILKMVESDQEKLYKIREMIRTSAAVKSELDLSVKKNFEASMESIAARIDANDRKLLDLESTTTLKDVIDREEKKAYARFEQERKEALERYRQLEMKKQEELLQQYQKRVEENRRKREEAQHREGFKVDKETIQWAIKKQEEKRKKEIRQKKVKTIVTSIPVSILGSFEVHLIFGLTRLIISLVLLLISYIPILNTLTEWLFRIREDTPDIFTMFLAVIIAYLGFMATVEHFIKKVDTKKLTLILTGICLIVFNIIFVIINLKYNDPILGNALLAIAGIAIFYKGKTT